MLKRGASSRMGSQRAFKRIPRRKLNAERRINQWLFLARA